MLSKLNSTLSSILTLVTLAAGIAITWYYINDLNDTVEDNALVLADIRAEQIYIRKELAIQSTSLQVIRHEQGSFDDLRDEHRWLAEIFFCKGSPAP